MRRLTDDTELQTLIAQGRGFLVKVTRGDLARVHPLEYLCYNARVQMRASSRVYSTYFAETREEINIHPYPWGREELKDCPLCEQERQRR
jgi:hypothetical protein